ncbi:MAG: hypothetical protein PHE52_02535 [Candidatus Pacebacteria bacterium]|nr:hypothetical protein [Candidatus Paceibacterota bacterium]
MEPNEIRITFDGIPLISKLTRLGGAGIPFNMDNKIELLEVGKDGKRTLLWTTYEKWNQEGYFLKVVKSKTCRFDNSYVETVTRCLLPMVSVWEKSKLEITEEEEKCQ